MKLDSSNLFLILVAVLLIIIAFFVGQCTKNCPNNQPSSQLIVKDSAFNITPASPIIIHDTVPKLKKIIISEKSLPDSTEIFKLIKERDSIAHILFIKSVQSLAILDTIIKPAMDSLHIEYNDFRNTWDSIRIGFASRSITIPIKTIYVNVPCPERKWYDTPLFSVGCGVTGVLVGYVLRGNTK